MTRYPRQGRGRRWTIKELEAVRREWKGDMLSDGDGLVGEVRLTTDGSVSLPFRYGFKWEGKKTWHYCGASIIREDLPATMYRPRRAGRHTALGGIAMSQTDAGYSGRTPPGSPY